MITAFSTDTAKAIDPDRLDRLRQIGGRQLVGKMIELFHEHCGRHVEVLRSIEEPAELRDAELAAHSLKTSAGNLGADRLYELAMGMEHSAARGELDAFRALRPELLNEFARASEALKVVQTSL